MNANELKQAGQQTALDHAGRKWTESTLDKLRAFCKARKDMGRSRFRLEEFRAVAEAAGWELPPTSKAWGALPRIARRAGIIRATDKFEPAKSPKTHSHWVRVWEAA